MNFSFKSNPGSLLDYVSCLQSIDLLSLYIIHFHNKALFVYSLGARDWSGSSLCSGLPARRGIFSSPTELCLRLLPTEIFIPTYHVQLYWDGLGKNYPHPPSRQFSTSWDASERNGEDRDADPGGLNEHVTFGGVKQNLVRHGLGDGTGSTQSKPGLVPSLDWFPTKRTRPKSASL
jgi:hypothetical protein